MHRGQLGVQCLTQEYLDTWRGGAEAQATDLPVGTPPALLPETHNEATLHLDRREKRLVTHQFLTS